MHGWFYQGEKKMDEIDKVLEEKTETKDYYVELVKENMKDSIESGMLKPEQQYALIEETLKELVAHNKINIEAVKKHKSDIKNLLKQLEDLQIKISEIYKKTYEKILEL